MFLGGRSLTIVPDDGKNASPEVREIRKIIGDYFKRKGMPFEFWREHYNVRKINCIL